MASSHPRRQAGSVLPWLLPLFASALAAWPLIATPSAATISCWCGVTGIAAWLGWLTRSRTAEAVAAATPDEPATATLADDSLRELVVQVLPVWEHHLVSVKSQTEHAVNELVASFGSLNRQFDDAGFVGGDTDQGGQATFSLLTLCERQLRPVVSTMNRMLDSKSALVRSVNELAHATKELQGMARDVGKIASHTNILAINAAVEAAHAGDAGRGFAVIANEIRKLSQTSAETGRKIAERMGQVEKITVTTVQAASEASEHDREAIELSGSVVQDVLEHVRELGRNAERMRTKGVVIRQDTENLLVNLQFQDRMSQILTALDQDMRRMHESARDRTALPDPQSWLASLSTTYTMDDQRAAGKSAPVAAAKTDEIEFF